MKVEKLQEKLEGFNPDAKVYFEDFGDYYDVKVTKDAEGNLIIELK